MKVIGNPKKQRGKSGGRKAGRPRKALSKLRWVQPAAGAPESRPLIYVSEPSDVARVEKLANDDPFLRAALDDLRAVHGEQAPLELINEAVARALERFERDFGVAAGQPEPVPVDYSADPIAAKTQAPGGGATLVGGSPVADANELYRAFAILLDLMSEAAESGLPQAAPECVHDHASRFIEQMNEFALSRAEAASWVLAQQLVSPLQAFFRKAGSRWPARSRKGSDRIPPSPSTEEQQALQEQEKELAEVLKRNGFDPSLQAVSDAIIASRAAGWYIRKFGPKKLAAEAAGRFALQRGKKLAERTVHESFHKYSPLEKMYHAERFAFYIPPHVPVISPADVLRAIRAAIAARRYYFRYLTREETRRSATDEREAANRLGIPKTELQKALPTLGTEADLAACNPETAGPDLPHDLITKRKPLRILIAGRGRRGDGLVSCTDGALSHRCRGAVIVQR